MNPLHRGKAPGAVLGAILLVACGGDPSHTLESATADTATAATEPADVVTSDAGTSTAGISTADAATSDAPTSPGSTADASTAGPSTSDAQTSDALRPDMPLACEPTTCVLAGKTCGAIPDGCGADLECGDCADPDSCGGGGVENVCGHPCVPVRAIFFDLGDTLVESDGGDMFVERPGVTTMIAELKGLGMRVGIISNTPDGFTMQDLEDVMVNPGFLDEFELVLLSSQAASPPKPDPQIYVEAHDLLFDAPPIEEVAHVSESLDELADQEQAPTQGARAAGMLGIHLSFESPSPLADYTFAPDQLDAIVAMAETEWLPCAEH